MEATWKLQTAMQGTSSPSTPPAQPPQPKPRQPPLPPKPRPPAAAEPTRAKHPNWHLFFFAVSQVFWGASEFLATALQSILKQLQLAVPSTRVQAWRHDLLLDRDVYRGQNGPPGKNMRVDDYEGHAL